MAYIPRHHITIIKVPIMGPISEKVGWSLFGIFSVITLITLVLGLLPITFVAGLVKKAG
ncbi:MAG: hypothetical protein LBR16_08615 [Treponema sp.]|nr:hypothetical protein [Treponema sp.]